MTQRPQPSVRIGAVLWIVAVVQYGAAQLIAAAAWNPAYSWSGNFISDLGNTACGQFAVPHGTASYVCSPRHALMNGSFILSGALTLIGAILVIAAFPAGRRRTWALGLWIVAGIGKAVVGLVPENTDAQLHTLGALNLPLGSVAILLLAGTVWSTRRGLAWFSIVVAVVGLIAGSLFSAAQYGSPGALLGLGQGTMERLAGYPGNLWMAVTGIVVLASYTRDRALEPAA